MPARCRFLQPCDPVAVELVDRSVDAVALEPPIAERAAVAKVPTGRTLGKPRVLAKQLLEDRHAREMSIELRYGWTADVQPAVAVVVQLQSEMRLSAGRDLPLQPSLERCVLR